MKKLLFLLDTDAMPSVFDTVVAYDGGADHVTGYGGLTPENVGVIVDDRYGESVLAELTAQGWWIGRPVEVPGSRPVEFDPRSSMGLPLLEWPASHIVKCLIFYHPDDDIDLRLQQEDRVCQLHADCVALDRELLLEVIVTSSKQHCDDHTVANVLRRFYNLGVFPAWWKFESQNAAGWQEISSAIASYDPLCHGVLLLGHSSNGRPMLLRGSSSPN